MKLSFIRKEEPFVFEVENESGAKCQIDASDSVGGQNKGLRPMELLASSLVGCLSIDLLLILKKQRKNPKVFEIEIEGIRKDTVPSAFDEIRLNISIDRELNNDSLIKNIDLVLEKYCSVSMSLNSQIKITYSINQK